MCVFVLHIWCWVLAVCVCVFWKLLIQGYWVGTAHEKRRRIDHRSGVDSQA